MNFGKCCPLGLPAEIKVKTSRNYKNYKADADYSISIKQVKLEYEKKPVSNLLGMQNVGFEQTFMKFIDSSNCDVFDLYLIIIFTKSTKTERCTDITAKDLNL